MVLMVQAKGVTVSLNAENIVCMGGDGKKYFIEISCRNADAYRFTCCPISPKESKKFVEACERVTSAHQQGRETFVCSLLEFNNIKFEKSSLCSHID